MRLLVIVGALVACGDKAPPVVTDSAAPDGFCPSPYLSVCNPLTQSGCCAGEKCTWKVDAVAPQYVGYVGCAPDGAADIGEPCKVSEPGARAGYDNCKRGLICSDYRGGAGTCKQICDPWGDLLQCGSGTTCATHPGLFGLPLTPPAAGMCDLACDPLADNDFDGNSPTLVKTGSTCGNDGCYGLPSYGTPPTTAFSCKPELNPGASLRHRSRCTVDNGCAPGQGSNDADLPSNGCSQGYLPLLREETGASTLICVALCKPKNCYRHHCGPRNEDRLGEAPHRCNSSDRVGSFNTAQNGEHCVFMWWHEVNDSGYLLPSEHSDTLGFCFDMSMYRYDSNGDNMLTSVDATLPACAQLQDGFGSGTNPSDPLTYFGAADLGCVDSTRLIGGMVRRRELASFRFARSPLLTK